MRRCSSRSSAACAGRRGARRDAACIPCLRPSRPPATASDVRRPPRAAPRGSRRPGRSQPRAPASVGCAGPRRGLSAGVPASLYEDRSPDPDCTRRIGHARGCIFSPRGRSFARRIIVAISTVNPATGEEVKTFDELSDEEIDRKLQLAADTFREYRKTSFEERSRMLLRAAEILESEAEDFGRLMTSEMGKTLAAATAEANKCARGCRYYAENAERFMADEEVELEGARAYIRYEPLGPILAIMPWNFPFWQVFRHAAPALMAGNVILLKHA